MVILKSNHGKENDLVATGKMPVVRPAYTGIQNGPQIEVRGDPAERGTGSPAFRAGCPTISCLGLSAFYGALV